MKLPILKLRKDQERRILAGHLWIYSNEIDTRETPLKQFSPGQQVAIHTHRNKWVAHAYVNPRSLICARVISRHPTETLDEELLTRRISNALALRERLFDSRCYRLVYGDSDLLPGLVVDRFGDYLSLQITTAGMDAVQAQIISVLERLLKPAGILLRNDTSMRELEGLEQSVSVATGNIPDKVRLEENGARFETSLREGQKSGWFYDQAGNRERMQRYIREGDSVLDICSYAGAWGVTAALAGAAEVSCVDASQTALEQTGSNAELNKVAERVETRQGDAFDVLRQIAADGRRFDMVILDPPAFIKRRKDQKQGEQAYRRLNSLGLEVLKNDGILITSSCSFHMEQNKLQNVVREAAIRQNTQLRLLEIGQQRQDHPVHPAIPETAYLKTLFFHKS
ncbi:MAG: class I SAM-dependent rRNA methyltransferase [Sedimenticolaceae bacterium]|nr:class I SAM-dependent rRNA methyltransferase [Sedimenticolaceae bacterium]